ncbi:MAG TPA: hypothetical protein VGL91_14100 [Acidobacteriota bacterium]
MLIEKSILQKAVGGRQKAENRRQTTGGRRQEAGSRRQEAGGRKQEAGSRRQEAGAGCSKESESRRADYSQICCFNGADAVAVPEGRPGRLEAGGVAAKRRYWRDSRWGVLLHDERLRGRRPTGRFSKGSKPECRPRGTAQK